MGVPGYNMGRFCATASFVGRAAIQNLPPCRAPLATALLLSLAAIPGLADEGSAPAEPAGPPVPAVSGSESDTALEKRCVEPGREGTAVIDQMQRGVYLSICSTALWFDGLFGTRRFDQDSDATFGRVGLYEVWDDRSGFDTRLRLRARFALPMMEERTRLILGRVGEKEVAEDTESQPGGSPPSSFQRVEDDVWLLGLGYSKDNGLKRGFDFGVGIRISTPVDPYTKGSYRRTFIVSDATALRTRETLFWRDSRGFGETTELGVDQLLTPKLLLRWDNTATLAEDVRRLEWTSALTLFQSISSRHGLAYSGFIAGVVNTDVPIRNYGVEVRYRQQFFREWLFIEGRTSLSWPRETLDEERKINPGLGLGFEMYFGPMPSEQMR